MVVIGVVKHCGLHSTSLSSSTSIVSIPMRRWAKFCRFLREVVVILILGSTTGSHFLLSTSYNNYFLGHRHCTKEALQYSINISGLSSSCNADEKDE